MQTKTLRDLRNRINEIIDACPEALDYPIITSSDDEGNAYNAVFYDAGLTVVSEISEYGINNDSRITDDTKVVIIN